jgi:hypothetical protein
MSADLGADLSWFRPVEARNEDPYGRRQTLGTYRKGSEGLNVKNPQPGFQYQWVNLYNDNEVSRRLDVQGFQLVRLTDPEGLGHTNWSAQKGTPQESLIMFGRRLALARIPIERHRQLREERRELYRQRINGPTSDFDERGAQMYAELRGLGRASAAGHAYYQRSDHGIEGEEIDLSQR